MELEVGFRDEFKDDIPEDVLNSEIAGASNKEDDVAFVFIDRVIYGCISLTDIAFLCANCEWSI